MIIIKKRLDNAPADPQSAEEEKRLHSPSQEALKSAQISALVQPTYQIGKTTPFGNVYAGRYPINEKGLECDLFQLTTTLKDMTGKTYTCLETIKETAGLVVEEHPCFESEPWKYHQSLSEYLQTHLQENKGNPFAFSRAFIPWPAPLIDITRHKINHPNKSDFVLTKSEWPDCAYEMLSCRPVSEYYFVCVSGITSTSNAWLPNFNRLGCVFFVAAPVLG